MNLFYINIFVHLAVLIFIFSRFYTWKKKDFKKPYTQDNWLKLAILSIVVLPVSFTVVSVELMSDNSQHLTEGEIEWCNERNINLKFCEDSWPLK